MSSEKIRQSFLEFFEKKGHIRFAQNQKSNIKNKNEKLKIYDVTGKIIRQLTSLRVEELSVSLDGISPGIYFVSLEREQKKEIQRLIIIP